MSFVKKLWVAGRAGGTPFTAADQNRLETGIDDLYNRPTIRLSRATVLGINNGAWTTVTWDQEDWDAQGLHAANAGAIVPNRLGLWAVFAHISFPTNATGHRDCQLNRTSAVDGGEAIGIVQPMPGAGDAGTQFTVYGETRVKSLADTFICQVLQSSGGALNLQVGTKFGARWLTDTP